MVIGVTVAAAPAQIARFAGIVTVGEGLMVTLMLAEATQLLAFTVREYTPVELTVVVSVVAPFDQV